MQYPNYRPRRLRKDKNFRRLISETKLSVDNLIMPYFVCEGESVRRPVSSMPGVNQLSIDNLIREVKVCADLNIPAIILFGVPDRKDALGTQAYSSRGIVQKAIKEIKKRKIDILVVADVCLCEYTSHGHCGVLLAKSEKLKAKNSGQNQKLSEKEFTVDNDSSLKLLAKTALSLVKAGVDMVAPSSMMDGQVKAIREVLDSKGYKDIPIMAYSAKYASSYFGPFRQAAGSQPAFGDRKTYQMDFANYKEALREISLDIQEGADIIMVKPALGYQDIITKAKDKFNIPLACFNVSGEYSMVKSAVELGWLEERKIVLEMLSGFKRSGADIIISYWAKDVAIWLND